jgi:hypothetical protein
MLPRVQVHFSWRTAVLCVCLGLSPMFRNFLEKASLRAFPVIILDDKIIDRAKSRLLNPNSSSISFEQELISSGYTFRHEFQEGLFIDSDQWTSLKYFWNELSPYEKSTVLTRMGYSENADLVFIYKHHPRNPTPL